MKMFKTRRMLTAALGFALSVGVASANNLSITNVSVEGHGATTALLKFDISWDNSWRYGSGDDQLYFHDAVWVFFKVKLDGGSDWQHVKLEGSGLNPDGFDSGSGTPLDLVVPADGMGMFVRRCGSDDAGGVAAQQVAAVWNLAAGGLSKNDKVRMQAFGIEMCYVPKGAFKVGDGLSDMGQLYAGGTGDDPQPFEITSAGAIECGNEAGKLWGVSQGNSQTDYTTMGGAGTIPADFPNGYNAFYCMKYAVTQGQYADFLNSLTRAQQTARCTATTPNYYMSGTAGGHTTPQSRNTVRLVEDSGEPQPRRYATVTPDRACNFLSWADLAAFTDWSGLRPMTELEFEKACRGPLPPVAGEYAWGTAAYTFISGLQGVDGSGEELYAAGNLVCINSSPSGPVRVGIFAVPSATREQAGASYWGIMELSGNVWERLVSIGHATGRAFTGLHGDGVLAVNGDANVEFWPPNAAGAGFRGGNFGQFASYTRVSDRLYAALAYPDRVPYYGGRAARSAP